MDEKLRGAVATKKIKDMKNPTILMNNNDFECFKKQVELKTNINIGDNPLYQGVPIKTSSLVDEGHIYVYDDDEFRSNL